MATVKLSKKKAHQIYRLKDGSIVPGGSTISKVGESEKHLIKWAWKLGTEGMDYTKVTDEAGHAGTVAHFLITCFFKGDTPDFSEFSQVEIDIGNLIFAKFLKTWDEQGLTFVSNELQLVSETHRYGGTLDIIARKRDGRLALVDEKSSPRIYGHMYRQVSAYENLYNENHEEKIAHRAIFRHGKKDPEDIEVRWLGNMDKHFNIFQKQLALFYGFKSL